MKPVGEAPAASPANLLAMTAVTWVVDAVSFLALGDVFTANMTCGVITAGCAIVHIQINSKRRHP
jgi:uncharacterized membrane protein YoaK (UPF0700 family)